MTLNNPSPAGVKATQGTYVGDATPNKAIAHGLGGAPVAILIVRLTATAYHIDGREAMIRAIGLGGLAVTVADATNFYVGNAANYPNSANESAITYSWTAFK